MRTVLSFLTLALTIVADAAAIWPDYANITMPPNIAPLNFAVEGGDGVYFVAADGDRLEAKVRGGVARWNGGEWKKFLGRHRGEDVVLTAGDLVATNRIAETDIDPVLTYRLIPPSYTGFSELGIYERDLTSFDERPLYRNSQSQLKQCVNCHTFNAADPDEYLFHVRAYEGGTVIVSKKYGERKVDLKRDGAIGGGVYPAWHPGGDFIAFSQNETRQLFYREHRDKIEVIDLRSDLALYDLAKDELLPIENSYEVFETFPTWSPDGTKLYSCRARTGFGGTMPTNELDRAELISANYTNLFYDLVVRDFDAATRSFSAPRMMVDGKFSRRSVTLPRVSRDGRWLVMTVGPYGQFHIWHREADLWEIDLEKNSLRPLVELNSADVESYHTFSSDGKWFVFSSRRDDGSRTRPYFAAFDPATGRFSKPFIIPVRDPDEHRERIFSYNIPEFATGKVKRTEQVTRRLVATGSSNLRDSVYFYPHIVSYAVSYLVLIVTAFGVFRKAGPWGFALMTVGLATGSLWAKESWGAFWQWDPKECAALATWLVFLVRFTVFRRSPVAKYLHWAGVALIVFTATVVNFSRHFAGLHSYVAP